MEGNTSFNGDIWGHNPPRLCLGIRYTRQDMFSHDDVLSGSLCSVPEVALRLPPANGLDPSGIEEGDGRFIYPTGGGDAFTVIRRWRCAYRDPEVALRLPPANGCDPSGIEEGDRRFIRPEWRCAYGDPEVALRLPPANGCDPSGIEEGDDLFIRPEVAMTGGGAALTVIRRWRCAYHRLMAGIPPGSKR